jgi:heparin/heparan-sulfate lyase
MNIPTVPLGHPRVYVRPSDLPAVRDRIASSRFAHDWQVVQEQADSSSSKATAAGPLCNAFIYLVQNDRTRGRKAVEDTLQILASSNDARVFNQPLHWAACVYDWCYDLLSDDEKRAFIREFIRIAGSHPPRYPASSCNAVVGHDTEGWLLTGQLQAGVAIYDESHDMYDAAAKLFFEKFVPVRNYYYPSHAHHQGDHYATRIIYDLGASWLFRRMGAGDVLSRQQQFVPYHYLYNFLANRRQFMRGDGTGDIQAGRRKSIMMLAGCYYADPCLLGLADSDLFDNQLLGFHEVFDLLLRPADVTDKGFDDLPLTKHFGWPINDMVARTGWSMDVASNDVTVLMRIGGTFFGNHQFRDMGTFQVYYKGLLAMATGVYARYGTPHWKAYYHQTLAHNGLLIFDPNEPVDSSVAMANTGGQRVPNAGRDHPDDLETLQTRGYEMAWTVGHALGPDPMKPEYSYIAGDITKAYTDKVSLVTRSMVTLTTGDVAYPAALVVFDRVVAKDPSFKKTWLLHTPQEPQISGCVSTVIRDQGPYHGKMEVRTLLPEAAEIHKVGGPGKDFWVDSLGQNFPAILPQESAEVGVDGWRIEVSPATTKASDRFLHVMTVMDAAVPTGPEVERLGGGNVVGAAVLDRAVVFGDADQQQEAVTFRLATGTKDRMKILACDLAPGWWRVTCDDRQLHARLPVSRAAASLYFEGPAGKYVLQRVDRAVPEDQPDRFSQDAAARSLESSR